VLQNRVCVVAIWLGRRELANQKWIQFVSVQSGHLSQNAVYRERERERGAEGRVGESERPVSVPLAWSLSTRSTDISLPLRYRVSFWHRDQLQCCHYSHFNGTVFKESTPKGKTARQKHRGTDRCGGGMQGRVGASLDQVSQVDFSL